MNLYIHKGNGFYIGSLVVVIARNEEDAHVEIRSYLDTAGLTTEEVCITNDLDLEWVLPQIVYSQNGDY